MSTSTIMIQLQWENNIAFQMVTNELGAGNIIVKAEENSNFEQFWSAIKATCILYMNQKLDTIGKEMAE